MQQRLIRAIGIWLAFVFLGLVEVEAEPAGSKGLIRDQKITVSGIQREYHLFVPEKPTNAPIVLLFHGHSGSSDDMVGLGARVAPEKIWVKIAQRENIILVVPNGLRVSRSEKGWNDCRSDAKTNSKADDVKFVGGLLDLVEKKYGANPKRIYAQGMSNGGHFCIRLAQEMPERLAAFAAISAANAKNSECKGSKVPVSALFMNGTEDPFLPFKGGQMTSKRGEVLSAAETVAYWVRRNGIASEPNTVMRADKNTTDGSRVKVSSYRNGTDNTEVVLFEIAGGGHAQPSSEERYSRAIKRILGNQNGDIEMAEEVWKFFRGRSK